jgi:hypothetical protein
MNIVETYREHKAEKKDYNEGYDQDYLDGGDEIR